MCVCVHACVCAVQSGTCCLASLRSSSHFLAAGLDHAVRLIAVGDGSVERTLMVRLCLALTVNFIILFISVIIMMPYGQAVTC